MSSFISKLNPRLLIIHFIASWLFLYGFHTIATLYDYSFLYTKQPPFMTQVLIQRKLESDMLIINEAGIIGLVLAYIISWRLSVKQNWFWLNSVLIFLIAFSLTAFDLLGWKQLRPICMFPGRVFEINSQPYLIMNVAIMLAVGCFLFFNKRVIGFINGGSKADKNPAANKQAAPSPEKKK